MEDQVVKLISETIHQGFQNTNQKIDAITTALSKHVEKDEVYWKMIDDQKAQLRLIRWLGGSGVAGSLGLWILNKLHIL